MTSKPTRDHTGEDEVESIELCRRDRRKFYAMLDADLPPRISRIELALAVVVPANLALLWKVFGEPRPAAVGTALLQLFT